MVINVENGLPVISIYKNQNDLNEGPVPPPFLAVIPLFEKNFVYWPAVGDDFTNSNHITYDLAVFNGTNFNRSPDFTLSSGLQTSPSQGNFNNRTFSIYSNNFINESSIIYVNSVDNSFHSARRICEGGGFSTLTTELSMKEEEYCPGETVEIVRSADTHWFSYKGEYYGQMASYSTIAAKSDTVIAFTPIFDINATLTLEVFIINVEEKIETISWDSIYACFNEPYTLEYDEPADSLAWFSFSAGLLANESTVSINVLKKDTISLYIGNNKGCDTIKNTIITPNIPPFEINGSMFQILKGESVQLEASGGVSYLWEPNIALSDNMISNPEASPISDITYIVNLTDSLNCEGQLEVLVKVMDSAYLPNLFTPNDDNQNDQLRVFGAETAESFEIVIKSREGSTVYKSTDLSDFKNRGWDGMSNGVKQPAGMYYWSVKGEIVSNKPFLLNGKENGSVLLVR